MSSTPSRGRGAPTLEQIRERVRSAGLRVTASRVAVLRRLWEARAPLTHAELADALAPEGWEAKTVHRNLTDLTEANLLRRADVGDHVWRFEVQRETAGAVHASRGHPHFVCGACGEVRCLPLDAIRVSAGVGLPACVRRGAVEVQLKRRCDRCA